MYGNRTILHVDDDPSLLTLVAARLASNGYHVVSHDDPTTCTQILYETGARVVLLDIDMPNVGGLEVLRSIKRIDGGIQVIMLTGMVSMSTALRSLRWGAEACIFKPIADFDTLLTATDAAFAKIDRWWQSMSELKQRKMQSSDSSSMLL